MFAEATKFSHVTMEELLKLRDLIKPSKSQLCHSMVLKIDKEKNSDIDSYCELLREIVFSMDEEADPAVFEQKYDVYMSKNGSKVLLNGMQLE